MKRTVRSNSGVALVLVLLVLVAMTFAAIGVMSSSQRDLAIVGRQVATQTALVASDGGLQSASGWFRSKQYFGPPQRVNAATISTSSLSGYWNVRNLGGIGSGTTSAVTNYSALAPDMTVNLGKTKVWFQASIIPNSVTFASRQVGEEAGKTVKYSYDLQSIASHGGVGVVTISQILTQAYNLNFYGG